VPLTRRHANKKTAVPAKGTTVTLACEGPVRNRWTRAVTHAFHFARTQQQCCQQAGRFSDLRLTARLLPIRLRRTVDNSLSDLCGGLDAHNTADAYSGATVADSHRVPIWSSQDRFLGTCKSDHADAKERMNDTMIVHVAWLSSSNRNFFVRVASGVGRKGQSQAGLATRLRLYVDGYPAVLFVELIEVVVQGECSLT
jgi:hypothetical protein